MNSITDHWSAQAKTKQVSVLSASDRDARVARVLANYRGVSAVARRAAAPPPVAEPSSPVARILANYRALTNAPVKLD